MQKSIEVAAEAYALKAVPKPEDVYSTKFLPPVDQRKPDLAEAFNLRALIYAAMGEDRLAEDSFARASQEWRASTGSKLSRPVGARVSP